jgi:FxLD family lantipeptide
MRQQKMTVRDTTPDDDFGLDVHLLEYADGAQLIYNTDDGCGSTCGACTTGAS